VWLDQRPYDEWRLFLLTGVLGGYTTFSAFSAESLTLLQRGQWSLALGHSLAHMLGALVCAALGMALARSVAGS
jgi:CrcB protein